MSEALAHILSRAPVIPVLTIVDAGVAVPLGRALVEGGLTVLEVTLRTAAAMDAIARMAGELPEAVIGAGTVTRAEQVAPLRALGVAFAVSPGATDALLDAAQASGLPFLPGVATPAEAMRAAERGLTHLKFFPAEASGGARAVRALAGPLPEIVFCPTGGIDAAGAADYLACPNVACVGGSWVAPREAVEKRDWDSVRELSRQASVGAIGRLARGARLQ